MMAARNQRELRAPRPAEAAPYYPGKKEAHKPEAPAKDPSLALQACELLSCREYRSTHPPALSRSGDLLERGPQLPGADGDVAWADRDRIGEEEQVQRVVDADERIVADRELDAVLIDPDVERVALVEEMSERDAAAGVGVVEGDIDLAEQAAEGVERYRDGEMLSNEVERD